MAKKRTKRTYTYLESDEGALDRQREGKVKVYDAPIKGDFTYYKMRDGRNKVRIMPRTWTKDEGAESWATPLYIHYGIGPDNAAYVCPRRQNNGECPICAEMDTAARSDDTEYADKLKPGLKMVAWCIDRQDEEAGPQVFLMPLTTVQSEIVARSKDEDTGARLKIDHPEDGYDVTFDKSGKGKTGTKYSAVSISRNPSFLCEDEDVEAEWLEFTNDNPIPTTFDIRPAEYLAKVFGAQPPTDDEDDDTPVTRSSRRSRSSEPEEVAEDEDEDELDLDLDEEEAPPRRSRRQSVPEPEVEDEDEEEEEAPSRRPRGRRSRPSLDDEDEEEPESAPQVRTRGRRSSTAGARGDG
jgi:hypothetical protein